MRSRVNRNGLAGKLVGYRFHPFPLLSVIQFEAVSTNPLYDLCFQRRYIAPVDSIGSTESKLLRGTRLLGLRVFVVGNRYGRLRWSEVGLLASLVLVPNHGSVNHANFVGRKAVEPRAFPFGLC